VPGQRLAQGLAYRPGGRPQHRLGAHDEPEWSSMPATTLTSSPLARNTRPITSICTTPSTARVPTAGSPPGAAYASSPPPARAAPAPGRHSTSPAPAPRRVRPPQPHDLGLDHRTHLMRARLRPRGPVHQPRQPAAAGIPAQPVMHRLPRHPIPPRHIGHARALVQDLQHCRYRCSATPRSTSTPGPFPATLMDRRQAPRQRKTPQAARSVVKEPELLSPTYRNRVRNLSPRNRNSGVKHVPGSHSSRRSERRSDDGQMTVR
jgi:hypothetical protein